MDSIAQAFRQLSVRPGLSVTVVSMLALGIGSVTAMYSVFDRMLLSPLPVPEPRELVNLISPGQKWGPSRTWRAVNDTDATFSYPMFRDLEADQTVFTGLAAHFDFPATLSRGTQTSSGRGLVVSGRYFDVLNLQAALGRLIGPQDTPRIDEANVVVLSHSYWQNRFGGNPDVLGEVLTVNGVDLTIVGVAPEEFHGTLSGWRPQVYVPLTLRWAMQPEAPRNEEDREAYWLYLFGRLRPGIDAGQAAEILNRRYAAILAETEAPLRAGLTDEQLEQFLSRRIVLQPGNRGHSVARAADVPQLTLLLGATAFVLLIVCVNIANLLLSQSPARGAEMAVRSSLGARRGQLIKQLMMESSVLALGGGILSVPAAVATLLAIQALIPNRLAGNFDPALNAGGVVFAAVLTVATLLLFSLPPALRVSSVNPIRLIRGQSPGASRVRAVGRLRGGFVPVQIALSLILLVLAGLFMRSLVNVSRADIGMHVERVATFSVAPLLSGYRADNLDVLYDRIVERYAAEPGVEAAASTAIPLMSNIALAASVSVAGAAEPPPQVVFSQGNPMVSAGFFDALSIPFVAGRDFTKADRLDRPAVTIVNESFVDVYGLGPDPLGQRVRIEGPSMPGTELEIVGVVADASYSFVKGILPQFFTPRPASADTFSTLYFYVRTEIDAELFLARIPEIMAEIAPNLPVDNVATLAQKSRDNWLADRIVTSLASAFAALATLLAGIGLYGVLTFSLLQRTRELGLRLALGAEPEKLRKMIFKQVGTMALVGGAVGLVLSIGLGRAAGAVLFGLSGFDPLVLVTAVVIIGSVILGASYVPARRASTIEPMQALRYE